MALTISWGCTNPNESEMYLMSFNIRYDNPEDGKNRWSNRLPIIDKYLNGRKPDIVGMQEVTYRQLTDLISVLHDYQYVGKGREDGKTKGEHTPIFWKQERFSLLENSQFWLSENPESIGIPGWDAALPRIVTWVKLLDNHTNQSIWLFNTHFDHKGIIARDKSIELIKDKILEIAPSGPVVVMGDFNIRREHHKFGDSIYYHLINTFKDEAGLVPSENYAKEVVNKGTSGNGFDEKWKTRPPYSVDYIFTNEYFSIHTHNLDYIIEDEIFISDHWPVTSLVSLKY